MNNGKANWIFEKGLIGLHKAREISNDAQKHYDFV